MPPNRRVLHILYRVVRGGAEHGTVDTVVGLRDAGHDARLVVIGVPGQSKLEDKLADNGVPVTYLEKGPGFSFRVYSQLGTLLREFRPDVFHMHMNLWRYALLPALKARVPAIVHTFHTTAVEEADGIERWLRRRYLGRPVRVAALSNAICASVHQLYGNTDCTQIFNGTDTASFARDEAVRQHLRQQLGVAPEELLIIFVARLAPMKNHALLLDCFARLAAGNDRLKLVFVGQGPEEQDLREQISRLGLGSRVILAGQQDNVRPYYWAADIAVQPSTREGQSQVLSEAMAAGLPVVCSDAGGMKEVVVHGDTGLIVPSGNGKAFEEALGSLIADPALRRRFGEAGIARAREYFDVAVMIRRHEEFYEQALAARASAD